MKIVSIGSGTGGNPSLSRAAVTLQNEGIDIELFSYTSEDVDGDERSFQQMLKHVKDADLILLVLHGGVPYFKKFPRLREHIEQTESPVFVHSEILEESLELRPYFRLPDKEYELVDRFIQLGGETNSRGLILWACNHIAKMDVETIEPVRPRIEGIYHPDHPDILDLEDHLARMDPDRPKAGILFWQGQWLTGDLKAIDALIRGLEDKGMEVLAIFTQSAPNPITGAVGVKNVIERYFMDQCNSLIEILVLNMGFSQLSLSSPGDGTTKEITYNFFDALDVPVLQAMTTYYSYEQWQEDIQGIGTMELSSNVVWPEYDGQIITVPIATTETSGDQGSREAVPI